MIGKKRKHEDEDIQNGIIFEHFTLITTYEDNTEDKNEYIKVITDEGQEIYICSLTRS